MMDQELRQKVGQLFMVGFDALEPNEHIIKMIREYRIGGVILFRRNVHTPQQLAALCRKLQEVNAEVSDIPLLIAIDQEGGMVMRIEQGVTPIPSAMAFQQAGSVEDCEQLSHVSATEMRALGINMLLAPVLDVNNNRLNPVIGVRAFGEDPQTVVKYGMAALRGMQDAGVVATAKHFPGHGDTATDTHYSMAVMPHGRERMEAVELLPFNAAIAQGVGAIMTAHVMFPAIEADASVPATLSHAVLTDLLRGEMGFDGVVISDCLEMAAISEGVGIARGAVGTLRAGADIVLISHREARQRAGLDAVLEAVEQGSLSLDRVEQAVARVGRLKHASAVREWAQLPEEPTGLMQHSALELAERVQRAALKVQGAFTALDASMPVALITIEVRSRSEIDEVALSRNKEPRSTMLDGLLACGIKVSEYAMSADAPASEISEALQFAKDAAQIVLQTYNAVLVPGQQQLLAALPQERLWLVAGRLPYDLDLAPLARGRLASYGCRPAALQPVVEKLVGRI